MSKGYDRIRAVLDAAGEHPENETQVMMEVIEIYHQEGDPEDCKEQFAIASGYVGMAYYYGWNVDKDLDKAFKPLLLGYLAGNRDILEELGMCYFNGWGTPQDDNMACLMWRTGMELGNKYCTLHYYVWEVENDRADEKTAAGLEALVNDPEDPQVEACAVLYEYYSREGDEDKAWEWREKGLELGSEIMQGIVEDEKEEEVGEDNWTRSDAVFFPQDEEDDDDEYEGYDDETEASHPGYPEVGEKYVIIAAVDDSFRIVQADAAKWDSLPALIGAERCDDMRCEKFRQVSKSLNLPGTLLGQLDRDAFRKSYLKPNWHASQWYDGMADLMGAMVICLEDKNYNPFSFSSKEEAQKVIDSLCR